MSIFWKDVRTAGWRRYADEGIKMTDESQQKLQDTMEKIINESNGGLVCIII